MANNHNTKVSTSKQAKAEKKIVVAVAAHENGSMDIYDV